MVLCGGQVTPWGGRTEDVSSPILDKSTGERIIIGRLATMEQPDAMAALEAATNAWNKGRGEWPQMKMRERIAAIRNLVIALRSKRGDIIKVLMWEICKNTTDAEAEFDRTMAFIDASIDAIEDLEDKEIYCRRASGIAAKLRRGPIGVMLAMGPFNYPFNETYTALIPALLMGNVVVMKIPSVGGLAHVLTMEAYASALPAGVVNFVSGSGRVTMGPIMETGVDIFAFIGSSRAADALLSSHPSLHRLRTFLSLEGKNLGIVEKDADLDVAAEQCMLGATSYNGQRCTAIKLIFVHEAVAEDFVRRLCDRVRILRVGLPWEQGVAITPLPEHGKVTYLQGLVDDAKSKGARVVNEGDGGGSFKGNLFSPAVVFPVSPEMRLWDEEQFGPVIPVAVFRDADSDGRPGVNDVFEYVYNTKYGLQAAIFSQSAETLSKYIDLLSNAVGRININTQCGRSPDCLPFSGRRSSANGTLSVNEALRMFSVPTVIAGKANENNIALMDDAEKHSNFLAPLFV